MLTNHRQQIAIFYPIRLQKNKKNSAEFAIYVGYDTI